MNTLSWLDSMIYLRRTAPQLRLNIRGNVAGQKKKKKVNFELGFHSHLILLLSSCHNYYSISSLVKHISSKNVKKSVCSDWFQPHCHSCIFNLSNHLIKKVTAYCHCCNLFYAQIYLCGYEM